MWRILRGVLAVLGLVVSLTGFVIFIGAAGGVWWLRSETNQRTDALATKAHTAVSAADHAVLFVGGVVDQGERDLKTAREHSANEPRARVNPLVQLSARHASERLAGSVERANAAVVTASDAVLVAETAIKLFDQDEQLKNWIPVPPEQLSQTQVDLNTASRELKNVRTILGIPISATGLLTDEQLRMVENALRQVRAIIERMNQTIATARERVDETKRTVDEWVLRVAIGVTVLGALGAAGQFFTMRFCWRVLRGKPV